MGAHDYRIYLLERIICQAKRAWQIPTHVVCNRMGPGDEGVEDLLAFIGAQVERKRPLIEVEGLKIEALPLSQEMRTNRTGRIPTTRRVGGRRLDLDDFCAKLSKEHRAIRASAVLFCRKDPKSGKGETLCHYAGFRLIHCLEMIMRCISLVPSPMHMRMESR